MNININELLIIAINASIKAGHAIMDVYETSFDVEKKKDNSPLTIADKNSHQVIEEYLSTTLLPLLSEEGKNIPYEERKEWEYFWMVDPLDGTKEFIKRNGEFTVNIALINKGKSILGVIYIPATRVLYFGANNSGAWKYTIKKNENISSEMLFTVGEKLPIVKAGRPYTVVASRSHLSPETNIFIEGLRAKHNQLDFISSGSSIKLCLVAEGSADVYPRFAPTMEWDTAAGQAIAEAAGAQVTDYVTKKPLIYNKPNLLNNWFVVSQ
jgi:3'(2'), 5'-bisphosphate nucleotidase